MEELIRFSRRESQAASPSLFKAASAAISPPQIFAGHSRGEDFNLVTDVGSSWGGGGSGVVGELGVGTEEEVCFFFCWPEENGGKSHHPSNTNTCLSVCFQQVEVVK